MAQIGRFAVNVISAVGSYGLMYNVETRPGRPPSAQIYGTSSFNAVLRATNIFENSSQVGSNWVDVSSPITSNGMYSLPEYHYGAILLQVNSVVGSLIMALG